MGNHNKLLGCQNDPRPATLQTPPLSSSLSEPDSHKKLFLWESIWPWFCETMRRSIIFVFMEVEMNHPFLPHRNLVTNLKFVRENRVASRYHESFRPVLVTRICAASLSCLLRRLSRYYDHLATYSKITPIQDVTTL